MTRFTAASLAVAAVASTVSTANAFVPSSAGASRFAATSVAKRDGQSSVRTRESVTLMVAQPPVKVQKV